MNLHSKDYYQDEKESCCNKAGEAKALLKCKASNPVTVIPTADTAVGTPGTAVLTPRLATLSLGTRCFNDPCIKFDFSTNLVITPGTDTAVAVTFQLNRLCKGETVATAIGNSWVYSTEAVITDIITFLICDCYSSCNIDCCTYFISASTVATLTVEDGGATTSTVTFNNSTLSALVVGK